SFCELIDLVVDEDKAILDFLKKTDLCLMISNTYDHDSNYSHIASYLIEKYHIKADFLDVIAEEDSESKIAFHIVDSYFLRNIINSAIVIKFTQRSLPLRINANIALPEYNCVEVLILERGGYSLADLKPNGTTLKQ
ncbi:MAG: hypothetical protein NTZ67_02075, partial [Gammaproteobacteria bacterium]|nr:hypothetical protein [Gammaproteobacteria bacterium]